MAKISVISDLHLGYAKNSEREGDPFRAADQAFKKAEDLGSDLILLAGDLFDSRFPRPEHWSKFMSLLSRFQGGEKATVTRMEGKENIPDGCLKGTPVLAIHGTHERRGEGLTNPVEALERAGFLVHLHCSSIGLKIANEEIAIHGMSGVPENYSKDVLNKWDPKPFEGAYNIFLLHQDLDPYIFNPVNPPSLGLEDLPHGFDCYVSGHIHWSELDEIRGKPFLIPGSLIPTQLRRREAEQAKGFFFLDTDSGEIDFVEMEPPRKFFYEGIEVNKEPLSEIEEEVGSRLEKIFSKSFEERPLVRIKLTGKLQEGVDSNDLDLASLKNKYGNQGIITISKDLEEEGTQEKIQMLRDARSEELSVDELGMKMLREQLEEVDSAIDPDPIFEDLVEGNVEKVMKELLEETEGKEVKEASQEEEETEDLEAKQEEKRREKPEGAEEWWRNAQG